jgi:hypothetical protein
MLCLALSACSSDAKHSDSTTVTSTPPPITSKSNWDAAASQSLVNLSRAITRAVEGECSDLSFLPRDQYVASAERLGLEPPLAVSDCSMSDQQIELNAFKSSVERDTFDRVRTRALCSLSMKAQVPILGLHFALTSTASIQAQSEGNARQIADAVGGRYQGVACPGAVLDWEPAAEARIDALASKLRSRPNLKCDDLQLLDRDTYARNQAYANRLPAAYARCNGPGGAVLWLAAFSPKSASRDAFVTGETKFLCRSQPGVTAVRGPDWALLVADAHIAAVAAAALGGEAAAPAC